MADIVIEELGAAFQGGQPPEQLHGGNFNPKGEWGESDILKRASDVATSAWEKLKALHDYRVNRNPENEPAVHARKLAKLVDEFGRDFAGQWQDVKNCLQRERQRVEADLTAKANLKADPALLNATLGTFQAMRPEQRSAAISELIDDPSGGPVLAILSEKSHVLTGLTKDERAAIKVRAFQKSDANGFALFRQIDKALERAERASLACLSAQQRLRDGTEKYDVKIQKSRELEAKLAGTVH